MKVFHDWKGLKNQFKNIVVGLGNFDGLHIGHQRLISALVEEAERIDGTSVIFTFNPHPLQVLTGKAPPRLLSQQAKEEILSKMGVQILLQVPFTNEFASLSPKEFIEQVLVQGLGVKSVFIGYNYTFGKRGSGAAKTLEEGGWHQGFKVHVLPPVTVEGVPVSSTLIRSLLADGNVEQTAKLLGQYPFVEETVVNGQKRGRTMGFPTANIFFQEGVTIPAGGVYAVKVLAEENVYQGVANIGFNPTFCCPPSTPVLEVHLLNFEGDLYGKKIKVFFIQRIREEKKFSSAEQLVEQIRADVEQARSILSQ